MLKTTRLAALAAVLLVAASAAVIPQAALAQTPPAPTAAPAAPGAPAASTAAPAAKPVGVKSTEIVDNPYGLQALWAGGDMVAKITLLILVVMSMGSWYIIITKVYEQFKMLRHGRTAEKSFWKAPSVKQGAEGLKKTSPYRFIAETGLEATARHTGALRRGRHERVDQHVDPARDRQRAEPHPGRPCVPGDGRLDRSVRRAVRNGVGHLPRADRHRHRRPGLDRQGRGSGG